MKEDLFRRKYDTYYIDIPSNKDYGFNFPFRIYIPKNVKNKPEIIYAWNLPRNKDQETTSFDELQEKTIGNTNSIDPMHIYLCFKKGNIMIVPFIPTFKSFRPNFLGRDVYFNDYSNVLPDSPFKDQLYRYNDLADQHKNMIIYTINLLKEKGYDVQDKVNLCGYSEGAKAVSHFALVHPEIIKSVIAGGTGGAISMPVKEIDGYEFIYPTGISDLPNFNIDEFSKINFFYYMGDIDKSDSAMPSFKEYHYKNENNEDTILVDECGNVTPYLEDGNPFILDENGNYTAHHSLFSDQEVNAINKVLGTKTQDRFIKQEKIYQGLKAEFHMYPGNHHTVLNYDKVYEDIDNFLKKINTRI